MWDTASCLLYTQSSIKSVEINSVEKSEERYAHLVFIYVYIVRDTPFVLKYLSPLIFSRNFDHSSYSEI
jgi:hypothetical protein